MGSLPVEPTAVVLDHFDYEINSVLGGAQLRSSDERRHIRVVHAGSDVIGTSQAMVSGRCE
jgi:hypothetical protein